MGNKKKYSINELTFYYSFLVHEMFMDIFNIFARIRFTWLDHGNSFEVKF